MSDLEQLRQFCLDQGFTWSGVTWGAKTGHNGKGYLYERGSSKRVHRVFGDPCDRLMVCDKLSSKNTKHPSSIKTSLTGLCYFDPSERLILIDPEHLTEVIPYDPKRELEELLPQVNTIVAKNGLELIRPLQNNLALLLGEVGSMQIVVVEYSDFQGLWTTWTHGNGAHPTLRAALEHVKPEVREYY